MPDLEDGGYWAPARNKDGTFNLAVGDGERRANPEFTKDEWVELIDFMRELLPEGDGQ